MDFDSYHYVAVINEIIFLTDLSRGSNLVKRLLNRRTRFEDDVVIFYKNGDQMPSE